MLQITCHKDSACQYSACQYAIHVILISSFDIRVMHAVSLRDQWIALTLRKMFVARSIGGCAIDRLVRKR